MKKHLSLHTIVRMIVLFETILCVIATLCLLMVNGPDSFSADHLSILLLVAITVASNLMIRTRKPLHHKTILWMSVLPMLFVSYEVVAAFLIPYQSL